MSGERLGDSISRQIPERARRPTQTETLQTCKQWVHSIRDQLVKVIKSNMKTIITIGNLSIPSSHYVNVHKMIAYQYSIVVKIYWSNRRYYRHIKFYNTGGLPEIRLTLVSRNETIFPYGSLSYRRLSGEGASFPAPVGLRCTDTYNERDEAPLAPCASLPYYCNSRHFTQ